MNENQKKAETQYRALPLCMSMWDVSGEVRGWVIVPDGIMNLEYFQRLAKDLNQKWDADGTLPPERALPLEYDVELVREQIIRPRQSHIQRINGFSDMKMNSFIEEFHVLMHSEGELDENDYKQPTLERFWNNDTF